MDQRRGNPCILMQGLCHMFVDTTFALIAIKEVTRKGGFFDSVARLCLAYGRTVKFNPILHSIWNEGCKVISGAPIEGMISLVRDDIRPSILILGLQDCVWRVTLLLKSPWGG